MCSRVELDHSIMSDIARVLPVSLHRRHSSAMTSFCVHFNRTRSIVVRLGFLRIPRAQMCEHARARFAVPIQ